ncbi:MAG: hypothetical protein ACLQIB_57865 [Isosphaeraceae bacterium]
MLIHKPRFIALTSLFLGAVTTGAGYPACARGMNNEPKSSPAGQQSPVAANPADSNPNPAPGRMFVAGRVLDPEGKPVPGATIVVHARSLAAGGARYPSGRSQIPIADARADGSGRFRIDAPRTSSSQHDAFGAVALAPGYGVGWVELDPDDDQPTVDISLRTEQVIHGRVFDLQGRPVPNVTLSVSSVRRVLPRAPGRVRNRFDGIAYWRTTANDFSAWPKPVTSNLEGRFTLRGVGQDLHAVLTVHNPRFALQRIEVDTDKASESKLLTAALVPAQVVTGRVTYADTGKPAPHAPLEVMASQGRVGVLAEFETDDEGRFRVNPPPADRSYRVRAFPPEGQPYLIATKRLEWPKGALEQSLDLSLPRGVIIHGKVTEEGSGKPVAEAMVDFVTHSERANREKKNIAVNTAPDGSFQLGADSSPGYLFVKGPSDDYVLQAIGSREVGEGQPRGRRIYSHAHTLLDLKPGIGSQQVNLILRRGATVKGQVVGPGGQPVRDAWMISRIILDPTLGAWSTWTGRKPGTVRNGRFEIHGLEPDTEVPVYFLEPKRRLGGGVNLTAKSAAGGPVTVRLGPCGAAKARVVDPGGKPVAGHLPQPLFIMMVVTPGPPAYSLANDQAGLLFADDDELRRVDPVNYENEPVADAGGRITLPVLIPGATYRVIDYSTAVRGQTGPEVRKEFTVKPGETVDLGDIRIEKPPR